MTRAGCRPLPRLVIRRDPPGFGAFSRVSRLLTSAVREELAAAWPAFAKEIREVT